MTDPAREALALLLAEVEASGNGNARDYGWPKALEAARRVLSSPQEQPPAAGMEPADESRMMFVARLEQMQRDGETWLTIVAVLALLNDCDYCVSMNAPPAPKPVTGEPLYYVQRFLIGGDRHAVCEVATGRVILRDIDAAIGWKHTERPERYVQDKLDPASFDAPAVTGEPSESAKGAGALDELVRDAEELGLYDTERDSSAVPRPVIDNCWFAMVDTLVDIWRDGRDNAPEDRCYIPGALAASMREAEAMLVKARSSTTASGNAPKRDARIKKDTP